jgi:lactoylglutathione lyase
VIAYDTGLSHVFNKVSAVIVLVSDMKKSMEFYRDTLGMKLKQESPEWVEFLGSPVIALHPVKKRKPTMERGSGGMLIGFNVSDLDAVSNQLAKKKVKFYKELVQETFGKHAIIEDPDGYLISLTEMKPTDEFTQIPYYHGFAPA